jgi:hypothetical protein
MDVKPVEGGHQLITVPITSLFASCCGILVKKLESDWSIVKARVRLVIISHFSRNGSRILGTYTGANFFPVVISREDILCMFQNCEICWRTDAESAKTALSPRTSAQNLIFWEITSRKEEAYNTVLSTFDSHRYSWLVINLGRTSCTE